MNTSPGPRGRAAGSDIFQEVLEAEGRIRPHVVRTPLSPSKWLSEAADCRAFLKLENRQHTGSFKFRGAMNKLLTMEPSQRARGVVAASTGNHGAAVARGARELGCPALIFAPETAAAGKLAAVAALGAEVRRAGEDCILAEAAARAHCSQHGLEYVSPYNDAMVVAGQGTIARELEAALGPDQLDAVFVAVGGGGLIAGIGCYLRESASDVRIVGASPRNSAVMHASLQAGQLLDLPSEPTLSDGTAGGVEAGSITFELCQEAIDDFVLVTEDQIRDALRGAMTEHGLAIEGAAGVAIAAFLARRENFAGKNVAIVICGGNIDGSVLEEILA